MGRSIRKGTRQSQRKTNHNPVSPRKQNRHKNGIKVNWMIKPCLLFDLQKMPKDTVVIAIVVTAVVIIIVVVVVVVVKTKQNRKQIFDYLLHIRKKCIRCFISVV